MVSYMQRTKSLTYPVILACVVLVTGTMLRSVAYADVANCEVTETCGQTATIEPTPEPDFVDATCDTKGYYTLPEAEGVEYRIGKNATLSAAGTYFADSGELVIISAYSTASSTEQGALATWSHTFAAPECPEVLGANTKVNTGGGHVLGDSTLVDTGFANQLPSLAALGLIAASLIFYRQPRRIHYRNRQG